MHAARLLNKEQHMAMLRWCTAAAAAYCLGYDMNMTVSAVEAYLLCLCCISNLQLTDVL